jgi:hypothetical protein
MREGFEILQGRRNGLDVEVSCAAVHLPNDLSDHCLILIGDTSSQIVEVEESSLVRGQIHTFA